MLKHPELGNALAHLYPKADFLHDYRCVDNGDGEGPWLAHWNAEKMGPEPTVKQIEKAAKELADAKPRREKKDKIRREISIDDFIQAYFESKLGNEAPMTALLERYTFSGKNLDFSSIKVTGWSPKVSEPVKEELQKGE